MRNRENHLSYERSIVGAVETLSSIAELEFDSPIAIAEEHEVSLQKKPFTFRTIHWLHKDNAGKMVQVVRETFRVILNYLKHFYKREFGKLVRHESIEGVKTIMVLVGDAAKKLDRFSKAINDKNVPSIKDSKEFHELFAFYKRKIAPILEQESLVKGMQMLPIQAVLESTKHVKSDIESDIQHLFIDLESVKNDNDYDLFLIRKEDGTRFFNPRLLRSVKLVCNFEEYFGEKSKEDPYQIIRSWQDREALYVAQSILRGCHQKINDFIKDAKNKVLSDTQILLYKSIIALMLASHEQETVSLEFQKSQLNYFADFQKFVRQIVTSLDYQKLLTYPTQNIAKLNQKVIEIVEDYIRYLYSTNHVPKDLIFFVNELIHKNALEHHHKKLSTTMNLAQDYESLLKGAKDFTHTPLIKVLNALQDLEIRGFDSQLLQNLPSAIFEMSYPGKTLALLKIPSPTQQDYIHEAHITEEFKGFLRCLSHDKPKREHLLINLQDRTSWREFARARALEDLQKKDEFAKQLSVVTLTKDSDFYFQVGAYQDLNHTDVFINHLLDHIASENSGYYYPEKVRKELFPKFAKTLAHAIHEIFFNKKNVMARSARMDFIELFYLFFELKIIDIVKPDSVSFTCKDSIDIGLPQTVELYLALKLLNDKPLSKEEFDYIKVILFGIPLLVRGRNLFSERFNRMNSALKVIEEAIGDKGVEGFHNLMKQQLKPLFKSDILKANISR
jgi:hypothetical protein